MIDSMIVICRVPVGLISTLAIFFVFTLTFMVETVVVFVCFPLLAIFGNRSTIQDSWFANYPNTLRKFFSFDEKVIVKKPSLSGIEREEITQMQGGFKMLKKIWTWVFTP